MTEYQALLMNEYAKLYATNWLKMDEGSGNTVWDSKGSATGTTSANATWVNGELKFSSTYRVLFSSPIFTRGSKTFVFDIKTTQNVSTYPHLFRTTSNNASGGNGFWLMLSEGKLIFVFQNSSTTKYFSPNKIISDGISHRVKFIQNGVDSTAKIKIYVDDVLLVNTTFGMTEPSYTNNMRLSGGSDVTMNDSFDGVIKNIIYFKEDIDNLKINKTLILHDGEYKKYENKYREFHETKMTSNTTPSPFVISSSGDYDSNYPAWKAFDGSNIDGIDSWVSTHHGYANSWIQIDYGEKRKVSKVSITSRNLVGTETTSLKDFFISYSDDNINFVEIARYTNCPSWASSEKRVFEFGKEANARHWRITVLNIQNPTTAPHASIGEIEFQYEKDIKKLSTVSSTLPTQEQFLIDGMDSLSPLLDRRVETLEPLSMKKETDILNVNEVGKIFSKTIDLKKYLDLRNITVKINK